MRTLLLALDAGTSGGRASLFTPSGELLAAARADWGYSTPPEAAPWGRAFDPESFWQILYDLTRRAIKQAGAIPAEVRGIGVTSQRQGIVLLDAAGVPLLAGPNIDLRGVYQGAEIDTQWGDLLYQVSGHRPALLFAPARLLWLRQRRPETFDRAATLLMISDWLTFRLTGARFSEPSAAAESQLFDLATGAWSDRLIETLALPHHIFPPIRQAGTVAGGLTRAAADDMGLVAGIPVAVGAADTQCGLLGMGIVSPGQTGVLAGWSLSAQQVLPSRLQADGRLWVSRHLLPGQWVLEGNAGPAGRMHAWLCRTTFGGASFAALDQLAAAAPVGANGAVALLGARGMDASAMGLNWGGLLFPLALDFLDCQQEDLARAVLESIAFAVKTNLDLLTAVTGPQSAAVGLGGGMANSPVFSQLLAEVLGCEVNVASTPHTSCLGAAMCGAVAASIHDNLFTAARVMAGRSVCCQPTPATHAEYLDVYERWTTAQDAVDHLSRHLA